MSPTALILVLRHELFEHLGHFADVLDDHEVPYFYHDLGEPMPANDIRAVIVMGGPMSANDNLPCLADELRIIGRALHDNIPLLGICLGSQLIAKALGAKVYRNQCLEIGWAPVMLTEAGQKDALLSGIESPTEFFHWHGETFDLPSGAELLAHSEKTIHQAYRYGRSAYGIQFHPEITPEMIADWCAQPVNCGDVAALTTPMNPYQADTKPVARQILRRWLALL